jgi:hypothetical protein
VNLLSASACSPSAEAARMETLSPVPDGLRPAHSGFLCSSSPGEAGPRRPRPSVVEAQVPPTITHESPMGHSGRYGYAARRAWTISSKPSITMVGGVRSVPSGRVRTTKPFVGAAFWGPDRGGCLSCEGTLHPLSLESSPGCLRGRAR